MNISKCTKLFLLFLFSSPFLWAAENSIKVITDRDVYVSGEIVFAKVYFTNGETSKVVYLDLLNKNGQHIIGSKLKVENKQASGFIAIPDSLSSGSCFLKVFTNQNRDRSYVLKELLVLNRFESDDQQLVVDIIHIEEEEKKGLDISYSNLEKTYSKRQTVQLEISIPDHQLSELEEDLVVSVTNQPGDFNTGSVNINNPEIDSLPIAEDEGIVLQGKVTDKSTGTAVWGATVMLSVSDSIPYLDCYKTNENGRFYFMMNDFYGSSPVIIQASKNGNNENLRIEISEKFRDTSIGYKTNHEALSKDVNEFAAKSIQLVNLKRIFNKKDYLLEKRNRNPVYPYPFYGEPTYQVDPDEFFDLADFNEVSKELLRAVKFRERDGEYSLNLLNEPMNIFFEKEPFILLDGVPIDSIPLFVKMGSRQIDWVDIIPSERFYGDLSFQGVLAIFTKKNDASLIPDSDHLLKFDYEGLQNEIRLLQEYSVEGNIPDLRQVLLWEPELKAKKEVNFNFRTSDVKGIYRIRIAGRTKSGEILESIQTFKVN